jgi:hypothetical protein
LGPSSQAGHDHALDPELHEDRAVWVCREDRTIVSSVGDLADS